MFTIDYLNVIYDMQRIEEIHLKGIVVTMTFGKR